MKAALLLAVLATAFHSAVGGDITFTNRIASFTNLQGQLYSRVQLIRGDQDGLIWRDGASGGRICYTNLHPDLLEYFGIPSDRVEIARARAEKKALADARYRAQLFSEARAKSGFQGRTNDADTPAPWSEGHAVPAAPAFAYSPDPTYPYPYTYPYFLAGPFDSTANSAPSAASAPSAGSAPGAAPFSTAGGAMNASPALPVGPAPSVAPALPARSAPSAPVLPFIPPRRR